MPGKRDVSGGLAARQQGRINVNCKIHQMIHCLGLKQVQFAHNNDISNDLHIRSTDAINDPRERTSDRNCNRKVYDLHTTSHYRRRNRAFVHIALVYGGLKKSL